MTSPEFGEHSALAQELFVGINNLTADVFLRSGLSAADITYSRVGLSKLRTPDEEVVLDIKTEQNGDYLIFYLESRRVQDEEDEVFEPLLTLDLKLQKEGSGLQFQYEKRVQPMTLTQASEYIIRRLPDFDGAAAAIEVLVPEAQ